MEKPYQEAIEKPEPLANGDNQWVGEKSIAAISDEDSDVHSCIQLPNGRHVLRISNSDISPITYFRIFAGDALALIDLANLNTTANDLHRDNQSLNDQLASAAIDVADLRAKLAEALDCGQDGPCAVSPGCQRHWSERNCELVEQLAIANETIASLRQRDTVRPVQITDEAIKRAQYVAWNEGHDARRLYSPINMNPYR